MNTKWKIQLSKQNKDFLKDSFYKHSETRVKRTDEMDQMCMIQLIEYLVTSHHKQKEKERDERHDRDTPQ